MNILRQSTPFCVVSAIALAALAVVRGFVAPNAAEAVGASGMPLAVWIEGCRNVGLGLYIPLTIVAVTLCLVNTLSASLYNVDASGRSSLPLQVWVLAGCCVAFPMQSLSAYIGAWLMTVALKNIAKAYKRSYSFGPVFMASFMIGVLPLLYAPFAVLIVVLPLVWLLAKRTSRELLVGMLGVMLPLFISSYVGWVRGGYFGSVYRHLGSEFCRGGLFQSEAVGTLQIAVMVAWMALAVTFSLGMITSSRIMRSKARVTGYIHIILLGVLICTMSVGGSGLVVVPTLAVLLSQLAPKAFGKRFASLSSVVYLLFAAAAVCYNICLFFPR